MAKTVTNQKTTFDANTNADISVKTYTVGGAEIQAVCLNSYTGAELGTTLAPLRFDPTGTTTQPVSFALGSIVQIQDSSGNNIDTDGAGNLKITGPISGLDVNIRDSSGGGISTTSSAVDVNLKTIGASGGLLSFDQKTMAGSIPVVIASNQSAVPVSGTFYQATQPVSATGGTPYSFGSLKTTVQTVLGAACVVTGYYIFNPDATTTWIQIFNTTSAVTLGTTTPTLSFGIPAGGAANLAGISLFALTTGFKIAATTTRAGSVAPTTGLDVNFWYK